MTPTQNDDPVVKATTDADIHGALLGVKNAQLDLVEAAHRKGSAAGMSLAFFLAYYSKLPDDVARRLTEIDADAVARITTATGLGLTGENLVRFAEKLASPAAIAQVIRAANAYRSRLGFEPLGPDGWLEGREGSA